MEQPPHISVIIPTLEEGKLLGRTLSQFTAALRSKYRLELIVSDGGSSDETVCVAQATADRVVTSEKGVRQNISIGRNAGARAAQGEILVFINADTFIDDTDSFFSEVVKVIAKEGVSAVTCNVLVHREEERRIDILFHSVYNWYFRFLNVIGMGMGRGECQVVGRDLFFSVGGYNEKIAAGEDFDLFVRLRRRGTIVFLHSQCVRESPRRYRRYGYLAVSIIWFVNALAVLVLGRSVTREWRPIR